MPRIQCGCLLLFLCAGMSAFRTDAQPSTPSPVPGQEPASSPVSPLPDRIPYVGAVTNLSPQRFLNDAGWSGIKNVRLSEMAARKTTDSQVRALAQLVVTDHSRANSELREFARRKGYRFPGTETLTNRVVGLRVVESRQGDGLTRDNYPADVSAADRLKRDPALRDHQKENVRESRGLDHPNPATHSFEEATAWQDVQAALSELEGTPDAEFDRVYLRMMVKAHVRDVRLFTGASRNLVEIELYQFASATLPKLLERQKQVEKLAQTKGGVASLSDKTSELRR